MRYSVHYIYDIICTMYDVKNLCVDNTTLEHMSDIICATEDVTSTLSSHNLYDIISTSGMTSHPLYQPSHPLYLGHHKLSSDIIPTFVWHHNNYMCDNICSLYNIISTPYVITLLYLWHHSLYIWNHIEYVGPHINYTCDITATNLCHHSHSIDNITHTLYDITLG